MTDTENTGNPEGADDTENAGPAAGLSDEPVAVVDVGSGAVKLLIIDRAGLAASSFDPEAAASGTVLSIGLKTKLIAGATDRMSDEALAATAAAFATFRGHIDELAPGAVLSGRVRAVATAVARDTSNLSALEDITRQELGVDLEVLSGEREAELAFVGATFGRTVDGQTVVMDIGAGSTEFAYRPATTDHDPEAKTGAGGIVALSLPIGGRTIVDGYLASDPPRPEELSSALSVVELHIDDLRRELPGINDALQGTVIAAGAMNQIAAVEIGLTDPEATIDGEVIEKEGIEDLFRTLATESVAQRLHNPGLKPEHVDDILGAICVLVEFMRQCGVDRVTVSERSVRHGLAVEMLEER